MDIITKEGWLSLVAEMKQYFYSCSCDEPLGMHHVHLHLRRDPKTGDEKYNTYVFAGDFYGEDDDVTLSPEQAREGFQRLIRCTSAAGDAIASLACCEVWRAHCSPEELKGAVKEHPGSTAHVALFVEHQDFGRQTYLTQITQQMDKRHLGVWEAVPWIPDLYESLIPPEQVSPSSQIEFRELLEAMHTAAQESV